MTDIEYAKILRAYIAHLIPYEGTDFLGPVGELCDIAGLDAAENEALTIIRDDVRAELGWPDYTTPQGER